MDVGDPAPDFTLTADDGSVVSLADLTGGSTVLFFYPAAFTPGCTTEACDFRDDHERFADEGYRVLGVSPDDPERLADFRDEHALPFRLLSDPDHTVAEAFGAWGTKKNYGREYEGLIRSTFVIGPDGTIERAWRNVRASGHVGRVLRDLG